MTGDINSFVYLNENISDFTLESTAISIIRKRKKIIYIDFVRSFENSMFSFAHITKHSFGKNSFCEIGASELTNALSNNEDIDVLYIRCRSDVDNVNVFKEIMASDIRQSIVLLDVGECKLSLVDFTLFHEDITKRKESLFLLRTNNNSFFRDIKQAKNTILYKTAKNIEFL